MEAAIERELGALEESAAEVLYLNLDGKFAGGVVAPGARGRLLALRELSLSNVGLQSLDEWPAMPQLIKLTLSDNKISGGLQPLASCSELSQLELSGCRIATLEALRPLAALGGLLALDLENCPVAETPGYRSLVYEMLPALQFLDRRDKDGKEVEEDDSDDDDDDDDDEDEYESDQDEGQEEVVEVGRARRCPLRLCSMVPFCSPLTISCLLLCFRAGRRR